MNTKQTARTPTPAETFKAAHAILAGSKSRHVRCVADELKVACNAHDDLVAALSAWSAERCEVDVLNPCLCGWNPSKPILHWGGGKACRVCVARAALAKAGAL